jgi:hypothetical protein
MQCRVNGVVINNTGYGASLGGQQSLNSLTAIGGHFRQLFDKLLW